MTAPKESGAVARPAGRAGPARGGGWWWPHRGLSSVLGAGVVLAGASSKRGAGVGGAGTGEASSAR